MSLIGIACISALIAVIYRYGMGVRVIRSRFNRSKLREDFNYNLWSKVLSRFVSPKSGKVDYRRLLKKKHLLEEHVAMLAVFGPQSTPSLFTQTNEQMAYWINAYNALVIFGICEYFPIDSITNVRTGWFCCSSSDYSVYQSKKKGKKNKRRRNKHNLFGNGINIKLNEKNELLIEDKDHAQTFVIMNDDHRDGNGNGKNKQSKAAKMRMAANQYWFFEALRFEVDGSLYSLREIERDIIRNKWGDSDARILCCLSKGCIGSPKLLNAPYLPATLDQQLNAMNRAFCSGIIKAKDLCLRGNHICISSVFKLYKQHYIKYAKEKKWQILSTSATNNDNGAILGYIYHFANKDMRNKLSYPMLCGFRIKYIEFDWRLSIHKSKKNKDEKEKKYQDSKGDKALKITAN